MLKRKISEDLIKWKNKKNKMPLLVTGARQVGKTYIIEKFAQENYESVIILNFIEKPELKNIFDGNLSSEEIYIQMSIRMEDIKFIPNNTLIFFDEIQNCENAITALKFLGSDKKYDIICSGSILGIAYKRVTSFPVGYIDRLEMYSLDFEEFCWANGISDEAIKYLYDCYVYKKTIPIGIHDKMMKLFKEYIVIGGMPAVVQEFINNKNFTTAFEVQNRIIKDYRDDIIKYANSDNKAKIRKCFDSIPNQLAQDNKKFKYSLFDKYGTSSKYESSLEWLYDAGIITYCHNLFIPELPLEGNAKSDVFKVYMCDTGLLMAMMEKGSQLEIIDGNLGIYKGAIYENVIADIFHKQGKKLYYFEQNSTLEIDFFIRFNNKICAVEVKSADNTKSKSLNSVMNKYNVKQAIKLSAKNIGTSDNNILSFPLYMAIFL